MKIKIYVIIAGFVLLTLSSCSDFLEKHPHDQLSSETFWKNENEATLALTGVYRGLQTGTYNFRRMMWDILAGDAYTIHGDYWESRQVTQGLMEETTAGIVTNVYTDCYKGIASCNFFLGKIDNVTMNEVLRDQYKGEALFLRALHYFTLTEFYGGVPLYTKSPTISESMIAQSSKETVVEQILSDLDQAIQYLPEAAYKGHAVKGSAQALKAKVLLHNERWKEAADAARLVIESDVFSLYNNYPNLFLTVGQVNNPEIIFSTQYLLPDNFTLNSGYNTTYGKECALGPLQRFVDTFECIDGLPITESPLYDPSDYRANRDPRLNYTVRPWDEPITNSKGQVWINVEQSGTDYSPIKYLNTENLPWDYSVNDDQDHILLRYSDVLLMYAEAKNEADGPDDSVFDALNAVRTRPSVNMPPVPNTLNKEQLRERIRHERAVEFGLEGTRYQDLKRWKTIETLYPQITVENIGVQYSFEAPKHYLLPFPRAERDLNPNLIQNPGY